MPSRPRYPEHVPAKEQKTREWQFGNGFAFLIRYPRQLPPIGALLGVLEQLREFLDEEKGENQIYADTQLPVAYAQVGRKFYANCYLYHSENNLPIQVWLKATAEAIAVAHTVLQIQEDVEGWRARINRDMQIQPHSDMWLFDAVNALDKRNGDLDCFEILIQHHTKS